MSTGIEESERLEVTGRLYPPGHAKGVEVTVSLLLSSHLTWRTTAPSLYKAVGDAVDTTDTTAAGQCSYDDLNITGRLASLEREVTLPDGSLLLLPNEHRVNRWLDRRKLSSRFYAWERRPRYVLASVLLVPLSFWMLWRYVLPAAAIQFAALVPDYYVDMASRHTLEALDSTFLEPTGLDQYEVQEYIDYWEGNLISLGLQPADYHIGFRNSETFGPNAFALPDGSIIFTDQLVELLNGDPDVLQAILLHEIGHVERHHGMRMVAQAIVATITVSILFGDLSGMAEFFVGTSSTVLQNKFSQELEWEADDYALQQLQSIPQGPRYFTEAMEQLAELVGQEGMAAQWLSSHPSMQRRVENARQQER